jgi:hypothetical protein
MEMSQGNSLYNYLKQTKLSFFKNKNREQEGRTGPRGWCQGEGGGCEETGG